MVSNCVSRESILLVVYLKPLIVDPSPGYQPYVLVSYAQSNDALTTALHQKILEIMELLR